MGLVPLLLLQVNAGDVASTVQLHAVLLLVAMETEHQCTQSFNVPCPQYNLVLVGPVDVQAVAVPVDSHGVVVDGSVFGGVPLKDELPVVQVARASPLLGPAQVALLMVDIL